MQSIGYWIQQHVLLMFAIGIIICNFIWLLFCRKQLNIKWAAALLIAILHDIVGYTAMRLLAIIEVGGGQPICACLGQYSCCHYSIILEQGYLREIHRS